ncbi:MAG: ABC transporter substrate-binding protein [Actinobacteria bacterium]|nr:ABC transporter substrate-binding protein [Actinomycetota bacterium]
MATTSVVVGLLAVVLVAAALPPGGGEGTGSNVTAGFGGGFSETGAEGDAMGEVEGEGVAFAPDGTPIGEGVDVAAGGAVGPAGSSSSSGRRASSTTGTAGGGSGTQQTGAKSGTAQEPLRASDRGISAKQIKVGFVTTPEAMGTALGWRTDRARVVKAYVDAANKQGGVAGRTVVYSEAEGDISNTSTQRAACLKLARDEKVFIAFDAGGTTGINHMCYAEQQLPHTFPTSSHLSEELFQQSGGYNLSSGASGTRILLNWLRVALEAGFVGPGKGKLGVLSEECDPSPAILDQHLKPALRRANVDFFESRVSCGTDESVQQAQGAARTMRNEGVDRVLLATGLGPAGAFIASAQSQVWKPMYLASDYKSQTENIAPGTYPPSQYDGAKAVTYSFKAGTEPGRAGITPGTEWCNKAMADAGLNPITDPAGSDAQVVSYCDGFLLWLAAMKKVPANPTRVDLIRAVETLSAFPSAIAHKASFRPGRYAAATSWAILEFRATHPCRCWVRVSEFAASND